MQNVGGSLASLSPRTSPDTRGPTIQHKHTTNSESKRKIFFCFDVFIWINIFKHLNKRGTIIVLASINLHVHRSYTIKQIQNHYNHEYNICIQRITVDARHDRSSYACTLTSLVTGSPINVHAIHVLGWWLRWLVCEIWPALTDSISTRWRDSRRVHLVHAYCRHEISFH